MGTVNVTTKSLIKDIYKTVAIPDPAYNYPATIQVAYKSNGFNRDIDVPGVSSTT